MTSKQTFWIVDPNGGAKALVEGAEERDRWTRVHRWDETGEPVSGDMVWAQNANTGGRTILPWDALTGGYWAGVGFAPSAPTEPVDLTKDPALRDQPQAAAETPTPSSKPAAGADSKDVTRG